MVSADFYSNSLLSAVIGSVNYSLFSLDKDFRYIFFNDHHLQTMKKIYDVDIHVGMRAIDILEDENDKKVSIEHFAKAMKGESFSVRQEYGLNEKIRSVYELKYNPVIEEGVITGVIISSINITGTVLAQQQLIEAEKRFRTIFEHSPDAIFVEDENGNILDVNPAAAELQGISRALLVGMNIRELCPPLQFREVLRDYKALFYGGVNYIESTVWSKDKGSIPVEITGKRIDYADKTAFLLHVRNISDRKKLDDEWAKMVDERSRQKETIIKESLKIREEERLRIAGEMHDEVGAGLSKISVLCQVIKQNKPGSQQAISSIEKIILASKQVQQDLGEIIWAMNPRNDTLDNLIAYIHHYSLEYLEPGDIKFNFTCDDKIPPIILNGKTRRNIFMIIKECLNNIVKHASSANTMLSCTFNDEMCILKIEDDGVGFNLNSVQRFKNGIGLMKRRMSEIGGHCAIQSVQGSGTKITLALPLFDEGVVFDEEEEGR
jgi:PAS domain S-box-containing protein